MARPTPMKDAAVNRLATSITQLTLCQITTSEIDAATKLLDKACQKLQGIQSVPSQRVTDLEITRRKQQRYNDSPMVTSKQTTATPRRNESGEN